MNETAAPTLRLFVAVRCAASPGLRRVLAALETARPKVRPVSVDDLHLTLHFLGDTPEWRLPAIAGALDQAAAAAGVGAFTVRWARLGCMPNDPRRPPRVLHAIPAEPQPFERLAAAVTDHLSRLNPPVAPEARPFTAHLTLARIKAHHGPARRAGSGDTQTLQAILQQFADTDLGDCRINALHLIASDLTPRGPIHTIKHETPLG